MADTLSALARVRRTQGTDLLPDSAIVQLLNGLGIRWSADPVAVELA